MRILIAGGSGFIGQALVQYFYQRGDQIWVLGRDRAKLNKFFGTTATAITWADLANSTLNNIQVVINLAGENIAAGLWTPARQQRLIASRLDSAERLVTWCQSLPEKPCCFISASGVGIYPHTATTVSDEDTPITSEQTTTFLARLAYVWEQACQPLQAAGVRVANLRLGAVLHPSGGMLKPLLLPYRCGLGARLGSGCQPLPWIALTDVIQAIAFIIGRAELSGPINLVAPQIITQAQFATTLASTLRRPCWLTIPASVIKLCLGQMGEELLLTGAKVAPKKLIDAGFHFSCPTIGTALQMTASPGSL